MPGPIRIGWNSIHNEFFVSDDAGLVSLPGVSRDLLADVADWQTYLLDHFTPEDSLLAGVWQPDARWWFVDEARRLDGEFRRQLAGRSECVRVSPYPGTIQLRIGADHATWPLWGFEGLTDPEDFPTMSDQLHSDLTAWAAANDVGRPDPIVGDDFVRRLRAELGPEFEVTY